VRLGLAAVLALALALAGCGGDDTETAPPPRPVEKLDRPAKLPPGWRTAVNRVGGFSIGVPPAWAARIHDTSLVLTSPDKQVAVSVAADRTDEAVDLAPGRNALDTARSLGGFEHVGVAAAAKPYRDRYEGTVVTARGTLASSGVPQKLQVVVLRRDHVAVYSILAATRANKPTPFSRQIDPIVRSLRGRPIA
jgi:hypothetical protein